MVEYAKTLKWNRWAGELDQVVAATRGAIESLKNAGHDDLPLDIRMRTDELTTSGMSLNDLGTISATDLRHLRSLKITVGEPYVDSESVELTPNRSAPAVEAEIKGTDRTLIDGLSAQLRRNLDSGHRFPRWYSRSELGSFLLPVLAVLPIPLAFMLSMFVRSVGWASRNGRWGPAEIGGSVVAITVPPVSTTDLLAVPGFGAVGIRWADARTPL